MVDTVISGGALSSFLDKVLFSFPWFRQSIEDTRRAYWNRTNYDKSILFTLTTTNKCTLKCDHCFEEAGPEKNDFLDVKTVEKIAEESTKIFPKYTQRFIRITGGDPFLHPDLPEIISSFSKREEGLRYDNIDVETNGWWATDEENTREKVSMVSEAGANLLSMSADYWHRKNADFDIDKHFNRVDKISKELGLTFRCIGGGFPIFEDGKIFSEVAPIGRARNLPEKYWGNHIICRAEGCRLTPPIFLSIKGAFFHTDEITIGPTGNVYPCNSGKEFEHATLSIGNVYEKSLSEIVDKQDNPLVSAIREEGLRALTKRAGISLRKHWQMYDKFSPCGLCHEVLREYGERINNNG